MNLEVEHTVYVTIAFLGSQEVDEQLRVSDAIFRHCWSKSISNVIYLVAEQTRTVLYTYFPYSEETCSQVRTNFYNFVYDDQFHYKKALFPRKCSNMYNCTVQVGTFEYPPYMMLHRLDNGSTYFDGIEGIVLRVLSQRLRFHPVHVAPNDEQRWGACYPGNNTCDGTLKLVGYGMVGQSWDCMIQDSV